MQRGGKNANCPVTVKFRAGWDENSINAVEFAKLIERQGQAPSPVTAGRERSFIQAKPIGI